MRQAAGQLQEGIGLLQDIRRRAVAVGIVPVVGAVEREGRQEGAWAQLLAEGSGGGKGRGLIAAADDTGGQEFSSGKEDPLAPAPQVQPQGGPGAVQLPAADGRGLHLHPIAGSHPFCLGQGIPGQGLEGDHPLPEEVPIASLPGGAQHLGAGEGLGKMPAEADLLHRSLSGNDIDQKPVLLLAEPYRDVSLAKVICSCSLCILFPDQDQIGNPLDHFWHGASFSAGGVVFGLSF